MSYRFSYSRDTALGLLLATSVLLPGCIDPKTVGIETDDGGTEDGSFTAGETDGMTSQGPGSATGGQTEGQTEGATDDSGSATDGTCPPIDIAECMQCECFDGEWACSNEGCVYECEDQACGDSCMMCPEGDPVCDSPEYEGICTADGQCVGAPPPELGFCVGALEPGFELELSEAGGCADMWVYAFDAADQRAVVLSAVDQLVADAVASGMPLHAEYDANDPVVSLEARAGFNVTAEECQDTPVEGVQIDELWLPTSGTVVIDIVPGAAEPSPLGTATVEFVDVVLERTQLGPAPILVPSLTVADIAVGWLPG